MTTLRFGSATDTGLVRTNNEDRYLVAEPLFAVADGMGGHAAGEVASLTAVESLKEAFTDHSPTGLEAATRAANRAVWEQAQSSPDLRGMGTTLVALALVGDAGHEVLAVANVGDSRLYRLHQGQLAQLTSDHSLVGQMVASGAITPEEAEVHPRRNVLTRALGVDPDVDVDLVTLEVQTGDRYLLCSDGLPRELSDDQMAAVLRGLADPDEAAHELVGRARAHGGNDNVTVVVIDLVDAEDRDEDKDQGKNQDLDKRRDEPTSALPVEDLPPEPRAGWWARRRIHKRTSPSNPRSSNPRSTNHLVTLRVILFVVGLIALVGIAFGGVAFYARQSYFVGLAGRQLVIFQGRPGGVLWFGPTVAERPDMTTAGVLPAHLAELRAGKVEGSLDAARQYVTNLHHEFVAARSANSEPVTAVPITTVPTTAVPATTMPTTSVPAATVPTTAAPTTTLQSRTTTTSLTSSGGSV